MSKRKIRSNFVDSIGFGKEKNIQAFERGLGMACFGIGLAAFGILNACNKYVTGTKWFKSTTDEGINGTNELYKAINKEE